MAAPRGWLPQPVPTCLLLLACGCLLAPAHAKSVLVDTFDALSKAVQDETIDEIVVSGALHVTSKLNVNRNLSITATSHGAASLVRRIPGVMLLVDTKGHVLISNLHIGGGTVQGSESAVEVRGHARFVNCYLYDHRTSEGQGGVIKNSGELMLTTCAFNNNHAVEGGAIHHAAGRVTLKSCQFTNNSAATGGGAISSYWKGSLTNCTFEYNSAEGAVPGIDSRLGGGAIAANKGADLNIQSCNFTGGAAYAGAAISLNPGLGNGLVWVEGSIFISNKATKGGAASVFTLLTPYTSNHASRVLTAVNCYFDHNIAKEGGALYVEGTLTMNNSIVANSHSEIGALAVALGASTTKVYNSKFRGNVARRGGAIGCIDGASELQIEETLFKGNSATSEDGGAILLLASSGASLCPLVATRCNFTRNFSNRDSGAIHVGATTAVNAQEPLKLTSCSFVGNVAQLSGGAIRSGSRLSITNSIFDSNQAADGGAIHNTGQEFYEQGTTFTGVRYTTDNSLSVTQCTFCNNSCTQVGRACTGGAIQNDFGNATITGSRFFNNNASLGGAFHSGGKVLQSTGCHFWPTNTIVEDSTFISNSAGKGGAVAVDASFDCKGARTANVSFHNVTLTNNTATNGGAFYITCHNATTCAMLDRCTLTDNIANDGGAAVYCNVVPNISCSDGRLLNIPAGCPDWVGNSAGNGYGNVFASAPVALRLSNTSFPPHTSQQPISNVSVYLVDQFEQVVYSARYDGTLISVVPNGSCNLLGDGKTAVYNGSATLSITVNGTVGSYVLQLSTDGAQLPVLHVSLSVGIRACQQGELATADGGCEPCNAPTFSWNKSAPNCSPCPGNATCFGGAVVVPEDGFWRSSFYSANILRCPNVEACTYTNRSSDLNASGWRGESVSAVHYHAQLCAKGYTGNLCAVCSHQYGMTRIIGKTQCRKCPSTTVKAVYMLTWVVVEVALVSALIALTVMPMRSASKGQLLNGPSQLKLSIHFLQLVALAFGIQHQWPAPIDYMTEALATIFLAQSQLLPLDCFMSSGGSSKAFRVTIIYAVLPVAATVPPVLFWSIQHWWSHGRRHQVTSDAHVTATTPSYGATFWQCIVPSILCVEYFLWPTTVANSLTLFSCRRVDTGARSQTDLFYINPDPVLGFYWQQDMNVKCWEGEHLAYALGFGIPGLLLSVLLFPGCLCWVLTFNRNKLDQPLLRRCWGFQYMMYKPRAYLWDVALHFVKLALVINSVLLVNAGGQAQNAIAFGIVTLAIFLHWHTQPYARPSTERLSSFAHTSASYFVFLGMLVFLHPSRGITVAFDVCFALGLGVSLVITFAAVARSAINEMRAFSPGKDKQANESVQTLHSDAWTSALVASSPSKSGISGGAIKRGCHTVGRLLHNATS